MNFLSQIEYGRKVKEAGKDTSRDPLKIEKTKDTIVKNFSNLQCRKISEGIGITLENRFSNLEYQKTGF